MPRNNTGQYSLPNGDQVAGNILTPGLWNGNFDDLASEMTNSLATTGVSTMTGALKGATGSVSAPGYTFGTATTTGFYLAGANQIGITTNGTQLATLNSDQSVTWAGNQSFGGTTTHTGTATFNGNAAHASTSSFTGAVTFNSTSYTFGAGAANAFWTGLSPKIDITAVFDGVGTTIASGQSFQVHIPFAMTITKWWIIADQSGSIVFDVLRANAAVPSSSIVGAGNKPTLTAAQIANAAPSGWTSTSLAADDFIAFSISGSPSSVQRVTVALTATRTGN